MSHGGGPLLPARMSCMADPTPFLSTITGASAGLVAIIGGLLVNRFVGIDSEQQGAQAVLDQAEQRLRIVRERAEEARRDWLAFEVAEILDDYRVLDSIQAGTREATELGPDVLDDTVLTTTQLQPHLREAGEEYDRAVARLDDLLHSADKYTEDEWRAATWEQFRLEAKADLPPIGRTSVWETAFDAVTNERVAQRKEEDARARAKNSLSAFGSFDIQDLTSGLTTFNPVVSALSRGQVAQRSEQERIRLTTAKERAEQQLEDAEAEAARLRERRDAVIRPDRQLWIGIGVLLYPTIVGIVLPVLVMREGPTAFTSGIRTLGWLFVTALAWLLLYMVYLAARLSRRHRTPPRGRS